MSRLVLLGFPEQETIGLYCGAGGKSGAGFQGFDEIPLDSVVLLRWGDGISGCFLHVDGPVVCLKWTGQGFDSHTISSPPSLSLVHAQLGHFGQFSLGHLQEFGVPLGRTFTPHQDGFSAKFSPQLLGSTWPALFHLSFACFQCFASTNAFETWSAMIKAWEFAPRLTPQVVLLLGLHIAALHEEDMIGEMPRLELVANRVLKVAEDEGYDEDEVCLVLRQSIAAAWGGCWENDEDDAQPTIVNTTIIATTTTLPTTNNSNNRMEWML
ncbi:hypothetical protein BASA81_000021 [Batrachochytrium salamandrivorans]|nr:hypothetical protein BASA81_000021 [Batrachochytrium salamandrivorans]